MTNFNTNNSSKAFHLDVQGFAPLELVPEALINVVSTQAGFVEGDEPAVRVPFVSVDDDAGFVAEGASIPEADPDDSETLIHTGKVALYVPISREQYMLQDTANLISESMRRALIKKANTAFLAQAAPVNPAVTPPAGVLNQSPTDGGTVTDSLDAVVDAVMGIEDAYGQATHVVASPDAWASLCILKTDSTSSNVSLIGAGVDPAQRTLLGVPVVVTPAMTSGKILVLDSNSVLSASGEIQLAVSDQHLFQADSYALRATWRFGQVIADTDRVVELTVEGDQS